MEKTRKRDFLQESWIWLTILIVYTFKYIRFKDEKSMGNYFSIYLFVYICLYIVNSLMTIESEEIRRRYLLNQLVLSGVYCTYEYLRGEIFAESLIASFALLAWNLFTSLRVTLKADEAGTGKKEIKGIIDKKMICVVCIGLIIFFWKKEMMEEVLLSFMYVYIAVNTAKYVKYREKNKKKRLQWNIWQSVLSILYVLYICIEWAYGVH